jgi:signal peptidase I
VTARAWPAAVAVAVAVTALRALRRRRLVATVVGTSMLPAFRPGERVLVRRPASDLRIGDVVVVVAPDSVDAAAPRLLVKRVAALAGDALSGGGVVPRGAVVVLGDNGGYDSRHFGPLPAEQVRGVVLRRLAPRAVGRPPRRGAAVPRSLGRDRHRAPSRHDR